MLTEQEIILAKIRYQNMRLIDNELMNIAFQDNNAAVEYVIRTILNRSDLSVVSTEMQRVQALPNSSRSVILDIVARDEIGRVYNIELQTKPILASAKRTRYHRSLLDSMQLNKGEDFSNLQETFVIFITDGPFLGLGNKTPIEFYRMTGEHTRTILPDGQTVVFANAQCQSDNSALASLMHDLTARHADDINSQVLKDAVQYAKGLKGEDMYIEGMNENQDEIWANATKATQKSLILSFYNLGVSMETIQKATGLSLDEIKQIINESGKC